MALTQTSVQVRKSLSIRLGAEEGDIQMSGRSQPFKLPGSEAGVRAYDAAFLVHVADSLATMRNAAIGYGYDTLAVMLEYAAREADRIQNGCDLDGNPV